MTRPVVYIDKTACKAFGFEFFKAATLRVSAAELLRSRDHRGGYDSHHQSVLVPLGKSIITLHRAEEDNPGWFQIISVKPPGQGAVTPNLHDEDYAYAPFCIVCKTQVGAVRMVPARYQPIPTLCWDCADPSMQREALRGNREGSLADELAEVSEPLLTGSDDDLSAEKPALPKVDLFYAITKAYEEDKMPVTRISKILEDCGYKLGSRRVLGHSGNMEIDNAMAEYRDLKRRGFTEKEIDGEMQSDRQFDEGDEEDYFHDIIDGKEFFDAALTSVKNSHIAFSVRKIESMRQNYPQAMRLLGCPLEAAND